MPVSDTASSAIGGQMPSLPMDGPSQTLAQLLRFARRSAPDLKVAEARRALAEVDAAAAAPWLPSNPSLNVSVGQRRTSNARDREWSVSLQQPLEIAGERSRRRTVARRSRERWSAARDVALWELRRSVHRSYRLAVVAEARVVLAAELLAQQQRALGVARRQVAAGATSAMAATLAAAEVARIEQVKVAAETRWMAQRWSLAELIGWTAATPPRPSGSLPATLPPLATVAELQARAASRPTLTAARARLALATAQQSLASRDATPHPSIGGMLTSEGAPGDTGAREWVWLATLSVPLPLWQRNQVARARADVERDIVSTEVEVSQRRVGPRIHQWITLVEGARRQVEIQREKLGPAYAVLNHQLGRAFELGELELADVLTAQDRLLRARLETLAAYETYYEVTAALEAWLGASPWRDGPRPPTADAGGLR